MKTNSYIEVNTQTRNPSDYIVKTLPFQVSSLKNSARTTPNSRKKQRNSLLPSLTHRKSDSTSSFLKSRVKNVQEVYEAVASNKDFFKILANFSEKEDEGDLEASLLVRNGKKFTHLLSKRLKKIDDVMDGFVASQLESQNKLLRDSILLIISNLFEMVQKSIVFISDPQENHLSRVRSHPSSTSNPSLNSLLNLLFDSFDPKVKEEHRLKISESLTEDYQRERLRIVVSDKHEEIKLMEKAEDYVNEWHRQREELVFQLNNKEKEMAGIRDYYKGSIIISSDDSKKILQMERTTINSNEESQEYLTRLDAYYKGLVEDANKRQARTKAQFDEIKEQLQKEKAISLSLSNSLKPKISHERFTQTGTIPSIENPKKDIEVSFLLPKDLVFALASMLSSSKIIDDIKRSQENLPILNFRDFSKRFIILNFGNSTIARILERDFLISVNEYCGVSERIGLFAEILGISNFDVASDYDFFRKYFLSSPLAAKLFCSIAHEVRKISKSDIFSTFLSNLCNGSEEKTYNKIEITALINKLSTIHALEEGHDELIKKAEIAMMTKKNLTGESGNLTLDEILKAFLNALSDHFCKDLERLSTTLKLGTANRKKKDYFSEEFLNNFSRLYEGKRSKFWIENLYVKVISSSDEGEGIPELFKNSMNVFFDETIKTSDFYAKKDGENAEIGLNDLILKIYDYSSSLATIQESYDTFLPSIKKEEAMNDNLYIIHEAFKKELNRMPRKVLYVKKIDQYFLAFSQNELYYALENLWKLFRTILDQVFSRL